MVYPRPSTAAFSLITGADHRPVPDLPAVRSLLEHGFTILHVDDVAARSAILGADWSARQLPPLREVVGENLRHDLDDAKQLQVGPRSARWALAARWGHAARPAAAEVVSENLHHDPSNAKQLQTGTRSARCGSVSGGLAARCSVTAGTAAAWGPGNRPGPRHEQCQAAAGGVRDASAAQVSDAVWSSPYP